MDAPNYLDLKDLVPRESQFTLTDFGDHKFTLRRWSLWVKEWAIEKYGPEELERIFSQLKISPIADLAWFMLKDPDKEKFKNSREIFLDHIAAVKDQLALITAMLETLGIGEPEIKKLQEAVAKRKAKGETPDPNARRPKKIGAKSLTR